MIPNRSRGGRKDKGRGKKKRKTYCKKGQIWNGRGLYLGKDQAVLSGH
jgi:hypothetical protein